MKNILLLEILIFLSSCSGINCEELEKSYRDDECLIVVETPPDGSVWFNVKGYHPETQASCKCKSANRWWDQYSEQIEIGDTIFKKKGELIFNIHKKDTVISHQWECTDTENRFLKHWGF